MKHIERLRDLAAFDREFAECAGNAWIWEVRMQLADDLEKEADELEARSGKASQLAHAHGE